MKRGSIDRRVENKNKKRIRIYDALEEDLEWASGHNDNTVDAFVERTLGKRSNASDIVDKKLRRKVVMLDNPGPKRTSHMKTTGKITEMRTKRRDKTVERLPSFANCGVMHCMWKEYAKKIFKNLEDFNNNKIAELLYRADLHGAIVRIVRSKDPSLVSLAGVIARETTNTFEIVTPESETKMVTKQGNEFYIQFKSFYAILRGDLMVKSRRTGESGTRKGRRRR